MLKLKSIIFSTYNISFIINFYAFSNLPSVFLIVPCSTSISHYNLQFLGKQLFWNTAEKSGTKLPFSRTTRTVQGQFSGFSKTTHEIPDFPGRLDPGVTLIGPVLAHSLAFIIH